MPWRIDEGFDLEAFLARPLVAFRYVVVVSQEEPSELATEKQPLRVLHLRSFGGVQLGQQLLGWEGSDRREDDHLRLFEVTFKGVDQERVDSGDGLAGVVAGLDVV